MIKRTRTLFSTLVLLASFAACGSDAGASANAGTIAGHWSQETGSDKKGMTLEFDSESEKLLVHTAPAEDGSHDHLDGTYTIDAKTGEVTVKCKLDASSDSWKGKLDGEHLTLSAGDQTLRFHKGNDPHEDEHK